MKKYIEAELAEAAMQKLEDDDFELYGGVNIPEGFDGSRAISALRAIPAADVEEIRHGKWELIGTRKTKTNIRYSYWCSQCFRIVTRDYDDMPTISEIYPYCHCGAKMDGEQ